MSIVEHRCVTVVCDGCGEKRDIDGMEPHYKDAGDARNTRRDDYFDRWRGEGTIDLCGACAAEPHDFKATERYPHICARCDELKDDDVHDAEERMERRLKPGHPDYDAFYDASDAELGTLVAEAASS